MEARSAGGLCASLGIALGILGFALVGIQEPLTYEAFGYSYKITYNPYILEGSILIGFGTSQVIAGVIFALAGREVTRIGLLAALLIGPLGAILWMMLSHEEGACFLSITLRHHGEAHAHCPNCGMAFPTHSTQFCPSCGEKLKQTELSELISSEEYLKRYDHPRNVEESDG